MINVILLVNKLISIHCHNELYLGVSRPFQYIVTILINPLIFGVFYHLPILSKTINVINQDNLPQMHCNIST